jgi:prevent-host-death family protein
MTATVEQTRQDLARLIRQAAAGEEILITENGRPVAKLTALPLERSNSDRKQWLESLRAMRNLTTTGKPGSSTDEILSDDRSSRR